MLIHNQCKNLKVQVNKTNPTWSMHYCTLLPRGGFNRTFEVIAKRFKELHPDITFVPNGECPWASYGDYQECPLYSDKQSQR